MTVKDLIALIPPPREPLDTVGDWAAVQAKLGIRYPSDFRQLIEQYGTGEFFERLIILNPLNLWCCQEIPKKLKKFRIMRDAMDLAWVIYPESSGLYPWGFDTNGNNFCWLTKGEPERWPVVQLGHNEEDDPHQANVNITTFLVNYARNKYPEMLGGIKFKKRDLRFTRGLVWE